MRTQMDLDQREDLKAFLMAEEKEEFSKTFTELSDNIFYEVWQKVEGSGIDMMKVEFTVDSNITEKDVHAVMSYPEASSAIIDSVVMIVLKELSIF